MGLFQPWRLQKRPRDRQLCLPAIAGKLRGSRRTSKRRQRQTHKRRVFWSPGGYNICRRCVEYYPAIGKLRRLRQPWRGWDSKWQETDCTQPSARHEAPTKLATSNNLQKVPRPWQRVDKRLRFVVSDRRVSVIVIVTSSSAGRKEEAVCCAASLAAYEYDHLLVSRRPTKHRERIASVSSADHSRLTIHPHRRGQLCPHSQWQTQQSSTVAIGPGAAPTGLHQGNRACGRLPALCGLRPKLPQV